MTIFETDQTSPENSSASRLDGFLRIAFHGALLAIAFTAGSILTTADLFPGSQISNAYKGGMALYQQSRTVHDVLNSDLWYPERSTKRGVTVNNSALTQPGATLYTSGEAGTAYLIDSTGGVLHKWHKPFSEIWTPESGIERPMPNSHVHFRKAIAFPNGDLLAVIEAAGDTPYGYGVIKLDRASNLLWSYFGRAHHDIDVGPDGRIYALVHGFVNKADKDFVNLATPRLLDTLVILSPEGKELKKIPLLEAVAESRYRHLVHTVPFYSVADPLHANDVDVITEEMARNFPFGRPGQILVSFRELNAIGVLDPDTQRMVWATRGPWLGQHDPDILPNGNILLFDNYGHFDTDPKRTSRVLEIDPRTLEIVWRYAGSPGHPLGSLIRSSQERLKNGNTLIVESNGGRIVEVTRDGQIAWEFVNPVRDGHPGGPLKVPIVSEAERIDLNRFAPGVLEPPGLTYAAP